MIDYPCAKFGDFSFSRFGFVVRTDREAQTPLNVLLPRLSSPPEAVGRNKKNLRLPGLCSDLALRELNSSPRTLTWF